MSEIWNLSALCRCCHADGAFKSLQAPYVHDGAIEIYAVLLRDTFGLHVNPPTVEASYSICECCIDQLRHAHRFKKQVLACERKFEEYCKNEQTVITSDIVKIEIENDNITIDDRDVGDDDDDNDIDDSDGGYTYSEMDIEFQGRNNGTTKQGKKRKRSVEQETDELVFCHFCKEQFNSKKEKRSHVFKQHVADGLSCKICKIAFGNHCALVGHFNTHDMHRQCCYCTEVCTSWRELKEHEYTSHIKLTGYVCDYCEQAFKNKSTLVRHIKWHNGIGIQEFKCETCGRMFNRKMNLMTHIRVVHEKLRAFQCSQCGRTYQSKKALVLHHRTHTGERPYKCDVCSKEFVNETNMKYHRQRHEPLIDDKIDSNMTDDSDGGDGADDSDGGYDNNDLEKKCDVEIQDGRRIEVEIKLETDTKAIVVPPSGDYGTDDTKIKQCVEDNDGDHTYDDFNNELEIEIEELEDDRKIEVEIKTKSKRKSKDNSKVTKERGKMIKQHKIARYSCDFCNEPFRRKEIMRAHLLDKHIADDYTCKICNLTFKGRRGMINHITHNHETQRYRCQFCVDTFKSLNTLREHEHGHTKQTGYVCDYCGSSFKWKKSLVQHVNWHNGIFKEFICETCGHVFRNRTNLKTHVMVVHDNLRPFKCDLCEKTYKSKKLYNNHRRLHTGERPYVCDVCSKGFASKDRMKVHRQRHLLDATTRTQLGGESLHQCHTCDKYFASAYCLKTHMDSHIKPFKCEICAEGFGQKAGLLRHQKSKHGPGQPASRSVCNICNKSYANWEIHKRIHDRKPFNCHLCDRFYSEKITLDRHLNMKHYKEKKFPCNICGTMFTRPECVRAHVERRHNSDGHKEKKVRTNNSKEPKQHRTVKVEVLEDNFDSVLPAYAIPKVGSKDDNNTAAVDQDAVLGI